MRNIFKSERLVYVPIEKDAKLNAFMHQLESDPHYVNSAMRLPIGRTHAASEKWIDEIYNYSMVAMYICVPPKPGSGDTEPVPVGCVSMKKNMDGMQHHGVGMIAISVIHSHHGKGYGSEAIRWITWWGFAVASLHRIEIGCVGWNLGAFRLYKKLGFKHEGTRRSVHFFMDMWHDVYELGMLHDEWRAMMQEKGEEIGTTLTSEKVAQIMGSA